MILSEVLGLGALSLSALVPLFAARVILGAIVMLLPGKRREG